MEEKEGIGNVDCITVHPFAFTVDIKETTLVFRLI